MERNSPAQSSVCGAVGARRVSEDARRSVTLAAVTARELGMEPVLARASALVRRLAPQGRLSTREREVAGLVARGSSNRDMARSLGLSERTIETHVQNVLTKLGFHSRTQIAAWAVAEGIDSAGYTGDRDGT